MLKDLALVMISPLNQTIFLIVLGLLLLKFKPTYKKSYQASFILAATWLYLCSQYFFSYLLLSPLETYVPAQKIENMVAKQNSAIFVLACFYYDAPDKPLVAQWNDCSLRRLMHAALMYKQAPQPIIVTGGDFNQYSDAIYAEAAKDFLGLLGVATQDIISIASAPGTRQEIRALIQHPRQFEHFYIVSSATHSYRLTYMMDEVKFDNFSLFPADYENINEFNFEPAMPSLLHMSRSRAAMYEYGAIVKMWLTSKPD